MDGFNSFSYEDVDILIEKGEEAARAMLPKIKAMLDSVRVSNARQRPVVAEMTEKIKITEVDCRDIDKRLIKQVEIILDIIHPKKSVILILREK